MERKISRLKWIASCLLMTIVMGACNSGQRLYIAEQKDRTNIRQPYQPEKKNGVDTAAINKVYAKADLDEKVPTFAELDPETGEYVVARQLGEVMVYGKTKSVAERNGEVNLEFVVRVPQNFLKPDWRMNIVPVLHNGDDVKKLDSICIRGKADRALNVRKNIYADKRARRWIRTMEGVKDRTGLVFSAKERKNQLAVANRTLKDMITENMFKQQGFRLDTVMGSDKDFYYFYTQKFNTTELQTRLKLYCDAYIINSGDKKFKLQHSDTLEYVISSMMQFLDRTPRYKREIIQRRVTESTSANVLFRMGEAAVVDTLADNYVELERIAQKIDELNRGNEFVIDSIVMTAYGSPEGFKAVNEQLAKKRAYALKEYLQPVINTNAEAQDLLVVKWDSEDWKRTKELIAKDNAIDNKLAILEIIEKQKDYDTRENQIRNLYPNDYQYIKDNIYPKVRSVDFKFYLARRNMVEETMYTDVIDTLYAEALELMDKRKYKQAMPKLLEYDDINTAICYLSLNYNGSAWNILINLPKTSDRQYLMAVTAARLGRKEMAVQLYSDACKMDENKILRGELDPEIAALIKEFGLNNNK